MKEAAGEANMTVITIVLIAIVLAVGTIIVNGVLNNTGRSSACSSAGGSWNGGKCVYTKTDGSEGTLTCTKLTTDDATTGAKKGEYQCQ